MKAAQGVRDGSVTLAFRRWQRQDVKPGAVFTSSSGLVRVDEVDVVDPAAITEADAVRAGWATADKLRARLTGDERRRGKLLPGYLADLVVLDRDPFEGPPENLEEIEVVATMVGGRWVHNPPPWD